MLTQAEQAILQKIPKPRSDNDPQKPEFPEDNPRFPATPTYRLTYKNFSHVWLKDESKNPTGTHKDRMAWELVLQYRQFLEAKKNGLVKGNLPSFSMISSGNGALAAGVAFKKYGLPKLKVLVDQHLSPRIINKLKQNHCELYFTDLSQRILSYQDILHLTNNPNGFDVTSNDALDRMTIFYDWMSFEIINNNPDYILCPFGTGELFENICNVLKREALKSTDIDPRLQIPQKELGKIQVIGITSNQANTIADKLYSPHLPFTHFNTQWLHFYKAFGYIGSESCVHAIEEKYIETAYQWMAEQNITCEPSGAAGMAYLMKFQKQLPKNKKILMVNTGKGIY